MSIKRFTNTLAAILAFCAILSPVTAVGSEDDELKAFPPAAEGMVRFVIALEHKARGEEDAFKVELIAGKEMLTDSVNIYRLGNAIEARTLQGWGYTYYEVVGKGEGMSTMMAPPEGSPMVKKFVTAAPLIIRYNSRLPIVVYAPAGYEIRYRIWQASEALLEADRR
ncbi:MAG TPA: ecotin family protein [Burkholderiales bacterium]|nr:ecotin family protein [Burkholderiales bacterium]